MNANPPHNLTRPPYTFIFDCVCASPDHSATAVLGCLKFTDGFRDAIPAWTIGLPIILALVVIAIPLCFLGIKTYKAGFGEIEGRVRSGGSPNLVGFLCNERVGAIHNYWITLNEEEV